MEGGGRKFGGVRMELSEKIKEHFRNPQNVGEIENPEGMGTINNPVCGDTTHLYLRLKDGVVQDAKFLSFGCAVTIASASVFTKNIKGKELSQLFSGSDEDVVKRLVGLIENELGEIPPLKLHCPPATVQAFFQAVEEYLRKRGETQLTSRINRLVPLISEYYKRGETEEHEK
jgi:nitrogen fixation NifU-like protein